MISRLKLIVAAVFVTLFACDERSTIREHESFAREWADRNAVRITGVNCDAGLGVFGCTFVSDGRPFSLMCHVEYDDAVEGQTVPPAHTVKCLAP